VRTATKRVRGLGTDSFVEPHRETLPAQRLCYFIGPRTRGERTHGLLIPPPPVHALIWKRNTPANTEMFACLNGTTQQRPGPSMGRPRSASHAAKSDVACPVSRPDRVRAPW
jgi:hypothetical protein